MADGETGAADSILRRMIGARRDEAPPPLTVHRALRLALSQLADEMFELDIEVRGIEDEQVDQSGAAQTLLEHAVFFLVEGPNGGTGMAIVSRDLVAALIEVQTMGEVTSRAAPERDATPTDAAMVEGYVDAALVRVGGMLAEVSGEEWTGGQRLGRAVFDLHQIPLELPDIGYRRLRVAIGFGADSKEGELVVILPTRLVAPAGVDLGRQAAEAARDWQDTVETSVLASEAQLSAILCRLSKSLAGIRALKPGDRIEVPAKAIANVRLEGLDRRLVAQGRLGMANGHKAIRLGQVGKNGQSAVQPTEIDGTAEVVEDQIDLDALGLGDGPAPDLEPATLGLSPGLGVPLTPRDLPDIGEDDGFSRLPDLPNPSDPPSTEVAPLDIDALSEGLNADTTLPVDDLPDLDIKPMTVDIE